MLRVSHSREGLCDKGHCKAGQGHKIQVMCSNYQEAGTPGVTIRSSCFWPASSFSTQFSLPASHEEGGTQLPFILPDCSCQSRGAPDFLPDPSSLLHASPGGTRIPPRSLPHCSTPTFSDGLLSILTLWRLFRVSPATGTLWLLLLECLLPLNDKASYMYRCFVCVYLSTMCALSVEYRKEPPSSWNKS